MSLARHEQRVLRRIDRALSSSAPQVHADFWAFGKMCSGQIMPGWEQIGAGQVGRRRRLARQLSQGALAALMYAGGITRPHDAGGEHSARQAGRW